MQTFLRLLRHGLRLLWQVLTMMQKELRKLVNGLSGKDRREKRQLLQHLRALRAEHNQVNHTMEEKQRLACLEIRGLTTLKQAAEAARDDLQLQVWELEQQVKELLDYIALAENADGDKAVRALPSEFPRDPLSVDLSIVYLGLVGGHPATRQGVIEELSTQYGLQHWVEIAPLKEARIRKNKLKRKLSRCNLIVVIADYMSHPLFHAVFSLRAAKAITEQVFLLNCHGKTGVVREILNLVKRQNIEK